LNWAAFLQIREGWEAVLFGGSQPEQRARFLQPVEYRGSDAGARLAAKDLLDF
jgi:hypothetical protein